MTPNAMPAYCYQVSVPDDGVVAIDLRKSVFTGIVIVSGTNTVFGMFVVRAASSPAITPMLTAGADLETAVAELTGTTGTDAKVTLGVQAGVLYLENRRGSTQNLHLTLLAGV